MSKSAIHGARRVIPASEILKALGDRLSLIRHEDGLTWADVGAVLGRSEDQAAKYADASAEMGAVALYRAKYAWNGRFTGAADQLGSDAWPAVDGFRAQSCLLRASLALSVALEDGKLTVEEIRANRSTLEAARDAISAQLERLKPQEARR